MIDKKLEEMYVRSGYSLYNGKRFMILKLYPKGHVKKYIEEIIDPFYALLTGILGIIMFPIGLINGVYRIIPKIKLKEKNNEKSTIDK